MAEKANALSKSAISHATPSKHAPSGFGIRTEPSFDHDTLATKDELLQLLNLVQFLRDDLKELSRVFSNALKDLKPDFGKFQNLFY